MKIPLERSLKIEQALALAHRALWRAGHEAESLTDQGLADDLYSLAMEVGRVNQSLLSQRGRRNVA